MRARAGLGMVLDAERARCGHPEALDDAVVEVHVRHLGAVEPVDLDRVVVVLARDLHAAGRLVPDRMVRTVVPEQELPLLRAERQAQDLVAEADAEHRDLAAQLRDGVDRAVDRLGIAGTVRQEHAVGLAREDVGRRGRRRHDLDPAPGADEVPHDRALDAVVVRDDRERRVGVTDDVRPVDRHPRHEIDPVRADGALGGGPRRRLVGAERARQRAVLRGGAVRAGGCRRR